MKTNSQRLTTEPKRKTSETAITPKRTERRFALRQQLVYHDPRQWDKDIVTGAGEE